MHAFDAPPAFLQIRDWLGHEQIARLLAYVEQHRDDFRPAGIYEDERARIDLDFRVSLKLRGAPEIAPEIEKRVRERQSEIAEALGMEQFDRGWFEIELVAHGDGAFYKLHVDEKGSATKKRLLSSVYYFYRQPRAFSGGTLHLHSLRASGAPGTFVDIEPENDSMVFFPPWFPHEVLPVSCPSGAFMDARFAINCWVHQ